jgi:integrase/recombinase XerD
MNNKVDRKVQIKTKKVELYNRDYFLLYSSELQVIREAFRFINCNQFEIVPINTKLHDLYALKYLYEFCEIFDRDAFSLTRDDISKLRHFLSGFSTKDNLNSYQLLTDRNSNTVDSFIYVYRKYYRFFGKTDCPIHSRNSVSKRDIKGSRSVKKSLTAPKYISLDEFRNILNSIIDSKSDFYIKLRNEVLVRIMFETGTRLGETLGLTFEDVKLYKSKNGVPFGLIYIRNRVSDKHYQSSKTTSKVDDISQYRGDYYVKGVGFQTVIITGYTYSLLNEYMNYIKDTPKFECKNAMADSVNDNLGYMNAYIFRNTLGGILSNVSWNLILRGLYQSSNIYVDQDKRTHNLSHRLRHGFIMRLIKEFPDRIEEIKKLSRHRSYESTFRYFNPTDEELSKGLEKLSLILLGDYINESK